MGNEFEFRVRANNEVGLGPAVITKDTASITKQVITWEKPTYQSRLIATAPEFTTEINHRNLTVGYNGVIHCAVKGFPKPTIKWYKNKLEIKGTHPVHMRISLQDLIVSLGLENVCQSLVNNAQ